MSRKRFATLLAGVLALGVLAAGCGSTEPQSSSGTQETTTESTTAGSGSTESTATESSTPATDFSVAMATDVGGLNDQSFNAAAWRGLENLKAETGAQNAVIESQRQEDYVTNLATLAGQGIDVVWGIGFLMTDAIAEVADQFPDTYFGLIDGVVEGRENVASVLFKEQEGSFLMGLFAAKTTQTGKVGFVGGMESDVISRFEYGFKAGVKAVDPSIEVITIYTGAFDNPAKGKEAALNIYGQGADVIFHASGACGLGVIEAAKEQDLLAIGVDSDQNHLAPEHVLSSMMKRVDVAVQTVSKQAMDGNFPGGEIVELGLAEDGVGWSDTTLWEKMPADTKDLATRWAEAIKSGQVTVPGTEEAFDTWEVPEI